MLLWCFKFLLLPIQTYKVRSLGHEWMLRRTLAFWRYSSTFQHFRSTGVNDRPFLADVLPGKLFFFLTALKAKIFQRFGGLLTLFLFILSFYIHYMVAIGYTLVYDEADVWWLVRATCLELVGFYDVLGLISLGTGSFKVRVSSRIDLPPIGLEPATYTSEALVAQYGICMVATGIFAY